MAEAEKHHQQQQSQSPEFPNISTSIWPPSQGTRNVVIRHLTETLSSPSTLTNRYGIVPADDASVAAKTVEEESFSAASAATADLVSSAENEASRGIEILKVYSKEISSRMLEVVKKAKANERPDDAV